MYIQAKKGVIAELYYYPVTGEVTSLYEREKTFNDMIEIALGTLSKKKEIKIFFTIHSLNSKQLPFLQGNK